MTYDRLYTVDEHRLISGVHNASDAMSFTPDCGDYASIQPCSGSIEGGECDRPKGYVGWTFYRTHDGEGRYAYHAGFHTLRFFYTCRVLQLAFRRTLERFPDWFDHEWVPFEPGWRTIEFTSPQRKEAEEFCERLVREIADSGEVSMREQFTIEPCDEFGPVASAEQSRTEDGLVHRHVLLVANVPEIDWQTNDLFDDITFGRKSFVPSPASFRFGYDDIASFLAYLSPWLLSLANAWDGGRPPLTELDRELFDAVSRWDIERALRLIDQGANVNALDAGGETPLAALGYLSNCYFEDPKEQIPPLPERDKIEMLRRLLEAPPTSICLAIAGGLQLCRAVNRRELKVVRFLLSRGADPNHNHELFYAPNDVSTALGDSSPSDYADPNAREERTMARIRKTLIKAGAVRRKGSPVTIIHVPHSSPVIPPAIRATLKLSDEELRHELLVMTDWYTDALFATPNGMAATITFPVSRLLVDPERFADDDHDADGGQGHGSRLHQDFGRQGFAAGSLRRGEEPVADSVLLSPPTTRTGCGASGPCRSWKVPARRCPQFLVEALASRTRSGRRPLPNMYWHRRLSQPPVAGGMGDGDVSETRFRCRRRSAIFGTFMPLDFYRRDPRCAVGNDRGQPKPVYG